MKRRARVADLNPAWPSRLDHLREKAEWDRDQAVLAGRVIGSVWVWRGPRDEWLTPAVYRLTDAQITAEGKYVERVDVLDGGWQGQAFTQHYVPDAAEQIWTGPGRASEDPLTVLARAIGGSSKMAENASEAEAPN